MAVSGIDGRDGNSYALDISQFKTDEEKVLLKEEIKKRKDYGGAFNEDGLIFFVPEMNLRLWEYPDTSPLKSKYFFMRMPLEDGQLGMNWTPFIQRVNKEYNWHHFTVKRPMCPYSNKDIFYKAGAMPVEPESTNVSLIHQQQFEIEQGGIIYKNLDVWETVNKELAFNNNQQPFVDAVSKYDIMV